jgi:hypothetical protein
MMRFREDSCSILPHEAPVPCSCRTAFGYDRAWFDIRAMKKQLNNEERVSP